MADVQLPDGSVASFPDTMSADDITGALKTHFGASTDNSGFFGTAASMASGLGEGLAASMQGTSPVVRNYQGALNYRPLGSLINSDAGPAYADQGGQWQLVDPTKHVVLNDPQTMQPTVFSRSPDTDETRATSLGRILGLGALAPSTVASPGLMAPAGQAIANRFASPDAKAMNQVGGALRADMAAGGPGPSQIGEALSTATDPMNVLDVAGENVRGLGGQVARMPGPGRQQIVSTLTERDAQAGPRLAQAVNDMGAAGDGTFLTAQALNNQAKSAAAPLYGRAYLAPPLNPDTIEAGGDLGKLMNRPAMQKAATNALSIAREEGRDPMALGITFNKAGDPTFEKVPSWQTLDYLKRGLDDVLNGYRDTTTGKLVLDERGRAIDQTRRAFLSLVDENNPDYAAARAAYAGPQQSRGALTQGAGALNKTPDEIASELSQLSPSEQNFYRLGAANALKTQLAKTSSGGNEARAMMGNAYRQSQLQAIFPNADQLLDVARGENTMFGTNQALLGGSQTAGRLAQDQGHGSGLIQPLMEAAVAAHTHEPMVAIKAGISAMTNLFKNGAMTPDVANRVAGLLLQADPQAARGGLLGAFQQTAPQAARVRPITPLIDMSMPGFGLLTGERRR